MVKVTPVLKVRIAGSKQSAVWDEVRPFEEREDSFDLTLVERIRRKLVLAAGLNDRYVEVSTWRRQALRPSANFTAKNAFHFDYGQSAGGVFSATLYVGHEAEEPLIGGWTAFVTSDPPECPAPHVDARVNLQANDDDTRTDRHSTSHQHASGCRDLPSRSIGLERHANGSVTLHRGLAVAPRIGRLILFSGGSDNYHAPMPVLQGRRQSLQIFFKCSC